MSRGNADCYRCYRTSSLARLWWARHSGWCRCCLPTWGLRPSPSVLAGAAYGVIGLASANLGRLSDRLRTPIGRRRPFLLVGDALAILAMFAIALIAGQNWAASTSIAAILGALALLYFGVQMVQPAMLALSLRDNFPVAQHGRVSGAVQTASVAGNLVITILIAATLDAFGFEFAFRALAFFAIPALLTGLLAYEGALDSATAQRRGTSPLSDPTTDPAARSLGRNELMQAFTTVRAYPRVVRFLGFAFVFSVGYNLMLWLSTLYFEQVLGFSESEIGLIVVALILLELLFALPWGWAADRFGKRRMLLLAVVLLALGDFFLAFINAQWQAYALLPLWALGDVAVFILPAALLSELIPAGHNANFMGLFLFIVAISLIVAAPISGLIFDLFAPRALPLIAGIVLLAALPLLQDK